MTIADVGSRNLNDTEMVHYDRQINVMQRGVFLGIKYGSQAMVVTSSDKPAPGGAFVVTGSCAGFLGSYSDLPYGTVSLGPLRKPLKSVPVWID